MVVTTTIEIVGEGRVETTSPIASGYFGFTTLRPGQYSLTVKAQGHLDYNATILLEQGSRTLDPISLVIEATHPSTAAFLSAYVFLDDQLQGGSHDGIVVQANLRSGEFVATTFTDRQGFCFVYIKTTSSIEFYQAWL